MNYAAPQYYWVERAIEVPNEPCFRRLSPRPAKRMFGSGNPPPLGVLSTDQH